MRLMRARRARQALSDTLSIASSDASYRAGSGTNNNNNTIGGELGSGSGGSSVDKEGVNTHAHTQP